MFHPDFTQGGDNRRELGLRMLRGHGQPQARGPGRNARWTDGANPVATSLKMRGERERGIIGAKHDRNDL
jgi:hypothetical protein